MSDLAGTTLGPYEVQEQIGQGGMATVYRAIQPAMGRTVAIKVLPAALAQDPPFVERFQQEARTIASLEHARILPVYDYGSDGPVTYLVMRYLDGGTLHQRILRDGPLTPEDAARIIGQVCEGLAYAHHKGVIHRDITANNIMFDEAGDAVITDFGMARLMEQSSHLTGSSIVGTPAYVSPEQGLGDPVDQRTDIYALGIVLYEMLIGDVPYRASTPMATVVKHINEPLPDPQASRPDLPAAVSAVIRRAAAKDPASRFATCEVFAAALDAALAGVDSSHFRTTLASSGTLNLPRQSLPKVRPYRWVLPVGIVAGLALIALVALFLWPGFLTPGPAVAQVPAMQPLETQPPAAVPSTQQPTGEPTAAPGEAPPATESPPLPTPRQMTGSPPDFGPVDLMVDEGLITCEPPTQPRYARDYREGQPDDVAVFGPEATALITPAEDALVFAPMATGAFLPIMMNGALVHAVVEVQAAWPEGPAAVTLFINDTPGGGQTYAFTIGSDGAYSIAVPNETPVTAPPAAASLFDGAPHRLRFTVLPGRLALAVDSIVVVSVDDPAPLPPGNLLFRVGQGRLSVDWLGVCAEVAGGQ